MITKPVLFVFFVLARHTYTLHFPPCSQDPLTTPPRRDPGSLSTVSVCSHPAPTSAVPKPGILKYSTHCSVIWPTSKGSLWPKYSKGNRCQPLGKEIALRRALLRGFPSFWDKLLPCLCFTVFSSYTLTAHSVLPWDTHGVLFFITPVQCTGLAHRPHLINVSWINDTPQGPSDSYWPESSLIFNSSLFSACVLKAPESGDIFNKDIK